MYSNARKLHLSDPDGPSVGRSGSDDADDRAGRCRVPSASIRSGEGEHLPLAGGGLIYNTYHRHLISISSLLLVVPGIFVASLGARPVLWVDLQKDRVLLHQRARHLEGQRRASDWFVLVVATPWWLISQLWPVGLAILAGEATEPGGDGGAPYRAFS